MAGLADAAQTAPVGVAYSYCNSGFVVLGRIIEVLDGSDWDESLRERMMSGELYQRLFGEVMEMYCGLTLPAPPQPLDGPVPFGLGRHAGRYERSSHRYDISVDDDGGLHAVSLMTGPLGEVFESRHEEFDLRPADSSGDNFVCRSREGEPWTTVSFSALDGGHPYLFSGGRLTLRAG